MLARLLYTHNRYLWLTILVIVMVGVASLRSLGRQEDPTHHQLPRRCYDVFPGAEPARVEALVAPDRRSPARDRARWTRSIRRHPRVSLP
jgi:multidrug efflux pump subunit AcrB